MVLFQSIRDAFGPLAFEAGKELVLRPQQEVSRNLPNVPEIEFIYESFQRLSDGDQIGLHANTAIHELGHQFDLEDLNRSGDTMNFMATARALRAWGLDARREQLRWIYSGQKSFNDVQRARIVQAIRSGILPGRDVQMEARDR
jgi:hypothetical protein